MANKFEQERVDAIYRSRVAARRAPKRLSVSEWAARHRVLAPESSGEPGRWRNERTPYLVEIMDSLSPDNGVTRVAFQKGTQCGGTEAGNNFLGWIFSHAPGPTMVVLPTLEMAKRSSRQRIAPMIRESEALRNLNMRESGRAATNNILAKDFPGGTLAMAGSQSAVALKSMPVRYLFMDEIDGFELDCEGEGDPIDLAMRRTDTYNKKKKVFMVSTPNIKGTSRVEALYELSDQRKYHVPCPHCDNYDSIEWKNIKFDKEKPYKDRDVHLACVECGCLIEESSKTEMLAKGKWVAGAESSDPALRGYQLNALYSPTGWVSWRDIVQEFLEAKRDADRRNYEKLKAWVNTRMATTWDDARGEQVSANVLFNRREKYPEKDNEILVPMDAFVLTCGVDVQKDYLAVETVAWNETRENWSMDWEFIHGDPNKKGVWRELDEHLRRPWKHEGGSDMNILCCLIDSGFLTTPVYEFVKPRQGRRVFASKGQPHEGTAIWKRSMLGRKGIRLINVGTHEAKRIVYNQLRYTEGDGFCHFLKSEKYDEEYFAQLTAETLVRKKTKGYDRYEWHQDRARNEALDCRVLAFAALLVLNPRWNMQRVSVERQRETLMQAADPSNNARRRRKRGVISQAHV